MNTAKKSPYDVGAAIYLDGEKEYKQAVANIGASMKTLNAEMKLAKSENIGAEDSMKSLREQYALQKDVVAQNEEKIRVLSGALEDAKEKYGENSRQVKKWSDDLIKAKTELNKSRAELEQLGEQKKAITHISNSLKEFKEKAEDVRDKLEKVASVGKKAGSMSLKAATTSIKGLGAAAGAAATAVTAIGAGMVSLAKDAADAGDEIDEASQRMGVSTKTFQELRYAAKMSGVEMATLETAAKTLQKNGDGLDMKQAIKQLASMTDEAARTEKAIELFGSKAAYSMGPMLSQGAEGIDKLMNAASEYSIVMSEDAVKASAAFNDSLDNMQFVLSAVKNNMAAEFLPGLTGVMDGIRGLFTGDENAVDTIYQGVEDISAAFGEIAPQISLILEVIVNSIAELAPQIIEVLSNGLSSTIEPIASAATSVLSTLISALIDNLDTIIDASISIIETLCSTLLMSDSLEKLISAAVDLIITIVSALGDNVDMLIDAALLIVDELVDGLTDGDNMDKLVKGSLDLVIGIAGGLIGAIPELLKGATQLINALVGALINYDWGSIGRRIWEKIKSVWSGKETEVENDIKVNGSHASGLYSVPFDGYIAELHAAERVLTASEAQAYNRGEHMSNEALRRQLESSQHQNSTEMYALLEEMRNIAAILRGGIGVDINNTRDVKRMVSGVA